jgi:predicted nucleic acid-binding Zn ribbon protein
MQAMRDILRTSLGKSLEHLTPLDRLAAAWTVAAGPATASRTAVSAIEDGTVFIDVPDAAWQRQLGSIAGQLQGDLARISRVPLTDILFLTPKERETPSRKSR